MNFLKNLFANYTIYFKIFVVKFITFNVFLKLFGGQRMRKLWMMFFVLSVVFASLASAVEKVDLRQAVDVMNKVREIRVSSNEAALCAALGFDSKTTLNLISQEKDNLNFTHSRYEMLYEGIPVVGYSLVVSEGQGRIQVMYGEAICGIGRDILSTRPEYDSKKALAIAKKHHEKKQSGWIYEHENSRLVVHVDDNSRARLCYEVTFFADVTNGGKPTEPMYILDAQTQEIVANYENLKTEIVKANGPGGNEKTGKYIFGITYPGFEVNYTSNKSTMNVPSKVMVVNLNHGSSGSSPYTFDGLENTYKSINGAFCPLNDAQAFGMAVFNMYTDWYNVPPLKSQLILKVHYSTSYENAFYSSFGGYMAFGDGKDRFYPLVSLDVVSHEVAHGFTRENSNLAYSAQSGGMNESFSDIAGEAAEYFLTGKNDFEVGATIFKTQGKALRYMYNPPLDGKSIGHVSNYTSGMDVHYTSGIYNKVFYLMASASKWDTKKAFDVFVRCNRFKWTSSTNYESGAKATLDATKELGYDTKAVIKAFQEVGITLSE